MKTGGVNYQVNFEVLPMKRSISTMLNEEAYPLLLGRGFLRQCAGVVDWSTKKPTFTYGPPSNRTQVLIEPKVERVGAKLGHGRLQTQSGFSRRLHQRILPLRQPYIQESRALALDCMILQMKMEHLYNG